MTFSSRVLLMLVFFGVAFSAFAGGPYLVDTVGTTGVPRTWRNHRVVWYSESGDLSNGVNNETAKVWIESAFAKWRDLTITNANGDAVTTDDVTIDYGGSVGVDIDTTNVGSYLSSEPGPSVIIFDKDGSLISILGLDKTKIVGLTSPTLTSDDGTQILRGFSIFNGYKLDGAPLSPDPATAQQLFQATIFHELGHLLNLDHAQVNDNIANACTLGGLCTDGQYIPTMYPELKTTLQGTPGRDDKIAISSLYPASVFGTDFCTITGSIVDAAGKPLRGVNVVASRVNDGTSLTRQDARSFITGASYPDCSNDSKYFLRGIVPGKSYQVVYEPLNSKYTGPSGFEPLDNPPSGFETGTVAGPQGETTVSCSEGGQTITMRTETINTPNPCSLFTAISSGAGGTNNNGSTDNGDGNSAPSSGGCSLIF